MKTNLFRSRGVLWIALLTLILATLACAGTAGDSGELVPGEADDGGAEAVDGEAEPEVEPTDEPTDEPEPTEEPTEEPTPTPEPEELSILLVAENSLSGRVSFTSFDEISQSLDALGYTYDTLDTNSRFPSASELSEYTVVIWSVGDDCCDSPPLESAEAIGGYLDNGGNLFIEGGAVAYSWTVQSNLNSYLDYLRVRQSDFTPMGDMVLVAPDHPLAAGFDASPIGLNVSSSVPPDVLTETGDIDVIFERGPNSASRETPALIAYEDGDVKVVFSAASVQWMPDDIRERLLENMMNWFTQ